MKVNKSNTLNILFCPLDWGMGHASRCVPLIRAAISEEHNVILASDGRASQFLKKEFPELKHARLPGASIQYPRYGWLMPFYILLQLPFILWAGYIEYLDTQKLQKEHGIDLIISDNRFFCRSSNCRSIYMTHQVCIAFPKMFRFAEKIGIWLHRKIQASFDETWIPDTSKFPGLAGKLSHQQSPYPQRFIGPLSRFSFQAKSDEGSIDLLILLSGVEPQRTLLEEKLLKQLAFLELRNIVFLRGLPGVEKLPNRFDESKYMNVQFQNHLQGDDLIQTIKNSKIVLARSGYTTIMELASLKKKAIFIPTPGQTEQEYLAELHGQSGHSLFAKQSTMNLQELLKQSTRLSKPEEIEFCKLTGLFQLK